jgi:hypothetical protein
MADRAVVTAKIYAYISAAWVELVDAGNVDGINFSWGITDNRPTSRLADVGQLRFSLNNNDGQYTPGGPSALAGWKKGIPVKLVCTFDGEDCTRFRGIISDIKIRPHFKDVKAYVTVVDWLDYASRHPVINPGIETNQRGDEVMQTIINLIEVDPQATEFEAGFETFPTAFDAVTSTTKAYEEFAKVALSELGYVYLAKDKDTGERLVFESSNTRQGWKLADDIPLDVASSSLLENENGSAGENEDGTPVHNNEAAAATIDGTTITDFEAVYGEHVINRFTCYANPRKLDTSAQVLFRLSAPQVIGAGQTITIKGTYADPNGGLPIHGKDMITPVATTDYLVYANSDGTGTNLTSSLSLISVVYGTEGFTHQVKNTNATVGYITQYNTRGTGIYVYNPIEHMASDSTSIAEFEAISESINQAYKNNLYSGSVFVKSNVNEYRQPRTVLNFVSFCANKSATNMMAFLYADVGGLYYISIPEAGITGNYYIQGIEVEMINKTVFVKWIVLAALSLQTGCGLSPLAVQFNGIVQDGAIVDGIDFGYLPKVTGLPNRTYSAWVYPTNDYTGYSAIIGNYTEERGIGFGAGNMNDTGAVLWFTAKFTVTSTVWASTVSGGKIHKNQWNHIVFTYDANNPTTHPILYIDNTTYALNGSDPAGVLSDETGANFSIGNINIPAVPYGYPFPGRIYDPRIYNRILTAAEVTTLYNAGTPDTTLVTDGLVFQGMNVRTGDLTSYVDQTLTSSLTVRDNIYGAIGTPHGAPIGRAAP